MFREKPVQFSVIDEKAIFGGNIVPFEAYKMAIWKKR